MIAQDEATSVVWGMPRAVAQAGLARRSCRSADCLRGQSAVCGRPRVTPDDYDFLRNSLKERSGLVLSADKQYLVESRLLPVARKAGLAISAISSPRSKRRQRIALMTAVVEAMTTNETSFFATRRRSRIFAPTFLPALLAARRPSRTFAFGAPPPRAVRSPIRSRWRSRSWNDSRRLADRHCSPPICPARCWKRRRPGIYSQFEVQRGLPIQLLIKYFSKVGDMWQITPELRAMVKFRQLNLLSDFSSARHVRSDLLPQRADLFRPGHQVDVLNRLGRSPRRRLSRSWRRRDRRGSDRRFKLVPELRGLYAPNVPPPRPQSSPGAGALRAWSPSMADAEPARFNLDLCVVIAGLVPAIHVLAPYLPPKQKPRPLGRGLYL